ncbi:hypothetical protein CROQUDRAFT_651807 [Cronartium quercuum f. sp. fusiforme G11]|uniref:Uncharacterized protein n=1 Tax=Cronartium quercuum f. sp. fusiforme G11 TaxID=708437 RepID=A0A9P6THN2_9BASI|nr:hypothetical protein CROQUDRAFT_651807 [Cronartium quercuum f. sp. fusiforme G11]
MHRLLDNTTVAARVVASGFLICALNLWQYVGKLKIIALLTKPRFNTFQLCSNSFLAQIPTRHFLVVNKPGESKRSFTRHKGRPRVS